MNTELREFIKWCDERCFLHQGESKFPVKHKNCKECWAIIKKENNIK